MNPFSKNGAARKRLLHRRRIFLGAQGMFIPAIFWQPIVMFWTSNTAIARFDDQFGWYAFALAWLTVGSLVLLFFDFLASRSDIVKNTNWTTMPIFYFISHLRPWAFLVCAFWEISLMTTVSTEHGWRPVVAYALFFVVMSLCGLVLALRDGCIDNRLSKRGGALCSNLSATSHSY